MATRKDAIFVSSSLGRAQGSKLRREQNASHDSLASHPLLSPPPALSDGPPRTSSLSLGSATTTTNPPSISVSDTSTNTQGKSVPSPTSSISSMNPTGQGSNTKYVPYTPRHRVSTSQVTVTVQSSPPGASSASVVSPSSPASASKPLSGAAGILGGATPQLQLQNLKAAAQQAQLTSGSVGWAICEKLNQEGETAEWEEIWNAVVVNKATMLLPMDQLAPQEVITPDYVRDHVVYCTAPSTKAVSVVTLSGLRGTLEDNALTLRSVIPTTSPQFQALAAPKSRISTLAALPPLPTALIVPLKPEYPIFNCPTPLTQLPFPSRPQHKPQPTARSGLSTPRLNPFASLFGARASPATTPVALPPVVASDESDVVKSSSADVPVYIIQGRIIKKDVIKGISASLKAETREALTGLPSWLIERALAFTASLHPQLPGTTKKTPARQASSSANAPPEPDMTDQAKASESFQDFWSSLEEELWNKENSSDASEKKGDAITTNAAAEQRRNQTVERVERAICALFYDHLFRQKNSDDSQHDEALASRIAALNMLDLGLEHLGIDAGKAGGSVRLVVEEVGAVLQRLQDFSCRAPVDKAATIVAAHTVAVQGLSRLPPIRLKPEDEVDNEPTPLAASFNQNRSPRSGARSLNLPEPIPAAIPEESSATNSPEGPKEVDSSPPADAPSAPSKPTPVASDVLLPFMIYCVVKSNPAELVSHLLYVQRYRMRSASMGGEEAFCLINLLAVVEFLENVDLAALGLGDTARVLSVADLAPLPLPLSPNAAGDGELSAAQRLRGRVNQQVEELAGSANKVIFGVVDSSFSALRGLLSTPITEGTPLPTEATSTSPTAVSPRTLEQHALWNTQRAGFGLLRRGTEFTLASVTSSLPALHRVTTGGSRRAGNTEEAGQMLVDVPSRPESIKISYGGSDESDEDNNEDDDEEEEEEGDGESDEHFDGDEHDQTKGGDTNTARSDVRSIRSFQSMMSGDSRDRRPPIPNLGKLERMSLSDRLASVSNRTRLQKDTSSFHAQSPQSKRASLLGASAPIQTSRPSSPSSSMRIMGPQDRFLECQAGDLRISEVAELLQEYRRVVEGMRALNGFIE